MKKKIKLSEVNQFALQNVELNSIKAGEAGICDYACGCTCACEPNNNYQQTNTSDQNAVNTENSGWAVDGTKVGIAIIIALL